MASAPDWSDEEKKLRRRLSRGPADFGSVEDIVGRARAAAAQPRASRGPRPHGEGLLRRAASGAAVDASRFREGGLFGEGGVVRGAWDDANTALQPVDDVMINRPREALRTLLVGRGGRARTAAPAAAVASAAAEQVAPGRIERDDPRNQFGNVFDSRSDLSPTALRGAGLQRVVKTADGTYTDAPTATGDVRYYNQFGNRADLGEVEYDSAGLTGPQAAAAHLAAENAAALDMSDPANARLVLERGREAQRQMTDRQAQLAERQQMEFLAGLDPADRAEMMTEQSKTNSLARAAAARDAVTMRGQDIQLQGQQAAGRRADEAAREKQDNLNRTFERENPGAALTEQLAELSNITGDDPQLLAAILSDPADKRGARARGVFRQLLAQAGGGDIVPGRVSEASGLRRFLHSPLTLGLTAPKYDANNGVIYDDLFDASDLGGIPDEYIQAFIKADRQARAGAR